MSNEKLEKKSLGFAFKYEKGWDMCRFRSLGVVYEKDLLGEAYQPDGCQGLCSLQTHLRPF